MVNEQEMYGDEDIRSEGYRIVQYDNKFVLQIVGLDIQESVNSLEGIANFTGESKEEIIQELRAALDDVTNAPVVKGSDSDRFTLVVTAERRK